MAHMIAWLGLGDDIASFVSQDVSEELIRQQPGSRLIQLHLCAEPVVETRALKNEDTSLATVTAFKADFPLQARVTMGGQSWLLDVNAIYRMEGMAAQETRQLTFDFNVNNAQEIR